MAASERVSRDLIPSTSVPPTSGAGGVVPALELEDFFTVGDWRLVLGADGWYLLVGERAERITVDAAVRKLAENPEVGNKARAPVFRATRKYFAKLGGILADEAWIGPTSGHPLSGSGLDPKLPAPQIADAGEIIAGLARELSEAEMGTPPPATGA
jgi:hypothetical protein